MRSERGKRTALWCFALVASLAFAASRAEAPKRYRWVDQDGAVHFADQPPEVEPPGGVEGPPRPTYEELRERDRLEAERAAAAAREARAKAEELRRAEEEAARILNQNTVESKYDCQQARDMLAFYRDPGGSVYGRDEDGRTHVMSAEELAAMVAEWERGVSLLCEDGEGGEPGAESVPGQ